MHESSNRFWTSPCSFWGSRSSWRESRNVFVAAGSAVLIVTVFFLIILASHGLGMHFLLTPAQAAWVPVMILVPWAVATSAPLRR